MIPSPHKRRKTDVAKSVEPVKISLKRGQTIVREGDTVTTSVLSQIAAIKNYGSNSRQWNRFLGLLALITAFYWVAWKFVQHRGYVNRLALSEEKTYALFGFIVVIHTFLMAIFFRVADFTAAQNLRAPWNDPTLWSLAIPFGVSSLLMTLLADRRTALFHRIVYSDDSRNSGAKRTRIRDLCRDFFGRCGLWNRSVQIAPVGNDGGEYGRFGKRGNGDRTSRLYATAVYPQHCFAFDRLRTRKRFGDCCCYGGLVADMRNAFWNPDRCKTS